MNLILLWFQNTAILTGGILLWLSVEIILYIEWINILKSSFSVVELVFPKSVATGQREIWLYFLGGVGGWGRECKNIVKDFYLEVDIVVVLYVLSLWDQLMDWNLKKVLRKDHHITVTVGTFNFHELFLQVKGIC